MWINVQILDDRESTWAIGLICSQRGTFIIIMIFEICFRQSCSWRGWTFL